MKGHWAESLLLMIFPNLMMAAVFMVASVTSLFGLALAYFVVPFYYNAFSRIWSFFDGSAKPGSKPDFRFRNYFSQPGISGCFGLIPAFAIGALAMMVMMYLLAATAMSPLLNATGHSNVAIEYHRLLDSGNMADLSAFLQESDTLVAFAKPTTIILSLAALVGLVVASFFLERNRAAYVLLLLAMPDAEKNVLGGRSLRVGGLRLSSSLYFQRMGKKAPATLPLFFLLILVYGGSLVGVSFLSFENIALAPLMASLPLLPTMLLATPLFVFSGALDVPCAMAIMPSVAARASQKDLDGIMTAFRNPQYVHSKEKAGQRPFQGFADPKGPYRPDSDRDVTGYDATSGYYTPSKKKPEEKTEPQPENPAEAKPTPKPEKPQRTYGALDLSKKDESNDKNE